MGTVQPIAAPEGQMPHLKDPKCINQLETKEEELPRVHQKGTPSWPFLWASLKKLRPGLKVNMSRMLEFG